MHEKTAQKVAIVLCQRAGVLYLSASLDHTEIGIAVLLIMMGPSLMVSHNLITHLHQHDLSTMRPV